MLYIGWRTSAKAPVWMSLVLSFGYGNGVKPLAASPFPPGLVLDSSEV